MEWDLVLMVGVMFAVSAYLLLDRYLTHVVIGAMLLSTSINVLLLLTSDNPDGKATPIFVEGQTLDYVDPLPQALALTAIVIGFGIVAFFIAMLTDVFNVADTEDLHHLFEEEYE